MPVTDAGTAGGVRGRHVRLNDVGGAALGRLSGLVPPRQAFRPGLFGTLGGPPGMRRGLLGLLGIALRVGEILQPRVGTELLADRRLLGVLDPRRLQTAGGLRLLAFGTVDLLAHPGQ
ncbi:hypothetical protein [Actinomadura vinacea]|uniref:hypothetical protein n=1 Tax=Actinomadura vinacea TaxID=115336 RepID=UPI0031D5E894